MSKYEEYDGEVDIKTTGKNLFHTIEIGGIKYTDNIPDGMNIGITKEQYIEYEQLKEENKQLKEEIKKIVVDNLTQINIERESEFVSLILKIIQEKEEIIYKAINLIKKAIAINDMTGNATLNLNELLEILGEKENRGE